MVLHNNKWDRKQNRDRVRKLKAKGKEDPANKDKHKEKEKEKDKLQKGGAPVEGSATDSDLDSDLVGSEVDEETGAGEKKEGETENEGNGHFSRRKVASNAWRYEEEEPEFPLDTSAPQEVPEEDYVALTLSRTGGQLKFDEEDKVREGMIDEAFLNESWGQKQKSKPKILKVDKKDFIDVTEKIAKQNNASAFRARFEKNKIKSRAPKVPGGDGGDADGGAGEGDDLDIFLGELNLDGVTGSHKYGTESSAQAPRQTRLIHHNEIDGNDEWLDQMLGSR